MNTERQAERNDAMFDALTDICERPREVAIWAEDLPTLPGFSFGNYIFDSPIIPG